MNTGSKAIRRLPGSSSIEAIPIVSRSRRRGIDRLVQRFYPNYTDESQRLDSTIREYLRSDARILDIGCGGGRLYPRDYRGAQRRVIGVDLDAAITHNQILDDRVLGSINELPFADGSFDLVFSRYVFEHLRAPDVALREVARIMKIRGVMIVLTPNRWHYVALLARATPNSLHKYLNMRLRGRATDGTFPTAYRANSRRTLARLARSAGLVEERLEMIETKPNYLMWSRPAFLAGVLYERLVNSYEILSGFRVNILAVYRKVRRHEG